LHSGIINGQLDALRRERSGTFPCRYVPGARRRPSRYHGLLGQLTVTLFGSSGLINKYVVLLRNGAPAKLIWPGVRGLKVPHTLEPRARDPQGHPESRNGEDTSHRR
jgi:hypothetical protein